MATYLENMTARRDAIAAELAAGQTPDGQSFRKMTISVDGEEIKRDQYVQRLYSELKELQSLINQAIEPYEVVDTGES